MERDVNKMSMPDYPDIVPIHPDLTDEELDEMIKEGIEKSKQYTDWTDV